MIAERPKLGFGAPSFEQEYIRFRTPEFYSMRHSAPRIDHPHNHLLYIAASFGILGLLCWLYLLLEPMYHASKRFDGLDPTISSSIAPFSSCPQSFPAIRVSSNELAIPIR